MMRIIPTSMRIGAALVVAALVMEALGGGLRPARAQRSAPQLVIVFDGSGSMWGRLAGSPRSKLAAMREELSATLRTRLPNVAVGLTTFGARSGGSCEAAWMPLLPFPGQLDQLDQHLGALNPQGRGPVVLGLRTAFESVRAMPGPVRLMLIHDSPDNCGQDVCAFAREMAAQAPQVSVDVISLGLKPAQRGAMACLTKATGGRLIQADTMETALAGVDSLVATLRAPRPVAARRKSDEKRVAALDDKRAVRVSPSAAGLTLKAQLAGSQTAIRKGLTWQINNLSKMTPPVDRSVQKAVVDLALKPATYRVTVHTQLHSLTKEIEVRKGARQTVLFEFDRGLVDIAPSSQAPPREASGSVVNVMRLGARDGSLKAVVWSGPAHAARTLLLEPGRYRIIVGNGLSQVTRTVDVTPGSSHKVPVAGTTARLVVTAAGLSSAQADTTEIRIERAAANKDADKAPDKNVVVARTAAARASFDLPPGSYRVILRAGDTQTSNVIVLAAGEIRAHTLELTQMALSVTSHIGAGDALSDANIRYRVWRAGQLKQPIAVSRDATPVFYLPPGRYRIESRIGLENAVMIREFDVGPGAAGNLQLRHTAGQVRFAAPPAARGPRQVAYWEVLDPEGRLVWRSFSDRPSATLAAGTYEATMEIKKQRYSTKFSVVAGQVQTVTVGTN